MRRGTVNSVGDVLLRLLPFVLLTVVSLPVSFLFPEWLPSGSTALVAFWIAESGSVRGMPIVVVGLLFCFVSRPGLSMGRRFQEAGILVLLMAVILGGVAWVNEHLVKPRVAAPRPNIRMLAESGHLGMSASAFYALPDKEARSGYLRERFDTVDLGVPDYIREHWIEETGFSFPSGHSLASMMLTFFFLGLGFAFLTGPRLVFFGLLWPWALLVCYSRPILKVHSPTDITFGGLLGMVLGLVAATAAVIWLKELSGQNRQPGRTQAF